jgi:hypothetical protein
MKRIPFLFAIHLLIALTAGLGWVVDPFWYSMVYLVIVTVEIWLMSSSDIASLTRRGFLSQWTTFLWGGIVVVWLLANLDALYFQQDWLSGLVSALVQIPWQAIVASVVAEFAESVLSSKLVPRLSSRTIAVDQ